jgi:hypothetical protein
MKMLHVSEKLGSTDSRGAPRTWNVAVNPMHIIKAEPDGDTVDLFLTNDCVCMVNLLRHAR